MAGGIAYNQVPVKFLDAFWGKLSERTEPDERLHQVVISKETYEGHTAYIFGCQTLRPHEDHYHFWYLRLFIGEPDVANLYNARATNRQIKKENWHVCICSEGALPAQRGRPAQARVLPRQASVEAVRQLRRNDHDPRSGFQQGSASQELAGALMVLIQWLLVAIAGTLLMAAFFASCWVLGQSVTLLFGG